VGGTEALEHEARGATEAEFLAAHPHPFLVFDAPDDEDELQFMTELGNAPRARRAVVVAAIQKRGESPFADRISVGRARNSDVVIRHASVSKLHAHFRNADDAMTLTDVGSHNGTRVESAALVPHRAERVRPGMTLQFGAVPARMVDAKRAFELLRRG
jgi:hypothetical protein